jgi:hypothetical protein
MPEDIEIAEPEEGGLEIEIIPESPEEKPRLRNGDTRSLDVRDDEIAGYGKGVQDRIKKLRFAFHEERRMREQSQRDQAAASELAQRLYRENAELKKNAQASEVAAVHQAISRVDAEIEQAKFKSRAAYDSGVSDDIVASNAALARAVAEKERLAALRIPSTEEKPADSAPPPQGQAQPDERTRDWFARNSWWQQPGEHERTAFAKGVHDHLIAQGVTPLGNPDLYWRTIDDRLKAVFPDKYANGNGNGNGRAPEREPSNSRPLAVAGGTRSNAGAAPANRTGNSVRLTPSQVRLARVLGITPQAYAEQIVLESREAN